LCNDTSSKVLLSAVPQNFTVFDSLDRTWQFATAVAMFGMKLKQSEFIRGANWDQIIEMGRRSADPSQYLQKEFIGLVQKAQELYEPSKKKKKKKKGSDD